MTKHYELSESSHGNLLAENVTADPTQLSGEGAGYVDNSFPILSRDRMKFM
jgi:hypothetical protein